MRALRTFAAAFFPFLFIFVTCPAPAGAQTLAWQPLSLDFGPVAQGETEYRKLTLTNTDKDSPSLEITDIQWTFNQMGAFDCKIDKYSCESGEWLPVSITPESSLEVLLSFTPQGFSFFMADLQITNTSKNAPVFIYSILGEGAWQTTTTTDTTTTTTTTPNSTTTTTVPTSHCGDPTDDGEITATDALFTLRAATGINICLLTVCDVNDDGKVAASDAQVILYASIGLPVTLKCPM